MTFKHLGGTLAAFLLFYLSWLSYDDLNHIARSQKPILSTAIYAHLNDVEAQFDYASSWPKHSENRIKWLRLAANAGLAKAKFALAEQIGRFSIDESFALLRESANMGYTEAREFIWQTALESKHYGLIVSSQWPAETQLMKETQLVAVLQESLFERAYKLAQSSTDKETNRLIASSGLFTERDRKDKNSSQCTVTLEFLATSWSSLIALDELRSELVTHPATASTNACLEPVKLSSQSITCVDVPRLYCDTARLREELTYTNSYLVVMSGEGKANVNEGVMYLPNNADISLFEHEFFHFFGFADEYELKGDFALLRCDENYVVDYPNIVSLDVADKKQWSDEKLRAWLLSQIPWGQFIQDNTDIFQRTNGEISLGTHSRIPDEVGLFPSDLCANKAIFKAVSDMTAMQFYELPMPRVYWEILNDVHEENAVRSAYESLGPID